VIFFYSFSSDEYLRSIEEARSEAIIKKAKKINELRAY
jgi:hypothetical protein